jgi:DNA segregation ATPase FtsK/SpoIIIE, S-DNA-T family
LALEIALAQSNVRREVRALIFLALAIFLFLALFSYDHLDPSFNVSSDRLHVLNYAGPVGAYTSDVLLLFFGLTAYLIPVALLIVAFTDFSQRQIDSGYTKLIGGLFLFLSICGFLDLFVHKWEVTAKLTDGTPRSFPMDSGGWIGASLVSTLQHSLGYAGSLLVFSTVLLLSLLFLIQLSLGKMLQSGTSQIAAMFRTMRTGLRKKVDSEMKIRERKKVIQKHIERIEKQTEIAPEPKLKKSDKKKEDITGVTETTVAPASSAIVPRQEEAPVQLDFRDMSENFILPPLTLLESPSTETTVDKKELVEKSKVITNKLAEFSISGQVTEIHPGPVVTTFEFKPEAGIKYSKIVGMSNDLCLALKAEAIRIDRLAGQATIGIEVPNKDRETIFLREIISSPVFGSSASPLTLGLGKLIHGEVYATDLMRMPHLMIAGSTNSGKSVAINSMLCSILYKATPEEVKFILIDPKRLELSLYEDIPHLMVPVVVEPKLASNALKWAVNEMEERYRLLASFNVRNIAQFNQIFVDEDLEATLTDEQRKQLKPLCYIVIVVDELADLMITCGAEVEESLQRLAQMARAVGIHLIVATQRPSVDVITGVIKANFPCRIAFRVPSGHDSKTILDTKGAEQLLGMGDMLFIPPLSSRLLRVHGAFVTEKEIQRLTKFWIRQGKPQYNEDVLREPVSKMDLEDFHDELYNDAVKVVITSGQASISHLQRRLRLGYGRAARMIDRMEAEGIVGPADGSRPRDILVKEDYLERLAEQELER